MSDKTKGMSYKTRRRWSLFVLLIGLPAYIIICVTIMNLLPRLHPLLELLIYVVMGVAWAFPIKAVFMGVGKEDPENTDT
ncbi:hypothetical protein GCM10008927_20930 [Amylibacter ulvae]|uniref:DUF2842 domain-containing protein n=1 Tax=Paramylibacter ulvae TaxID=1651968 RepID=A0ABQ3D691_9RHOB|nr:DUF2842 domain-containing protein [Amylibacter ulvae]GHA54917.1 hypothetical protein GCM10008927_20930 [Amylibacter ulvae]